MLVNTPLSAALLGGDEIQRTIDRALKDFLGTNPSTLKPEQLLEQFSAAFRKESHNGVETFVPQPARLRHAQGNPQERTPFQNNLVTSYECALEQLEPRLERLKPVGERRCCPPEEYEGHKAVLQGSLTELLTEFQRVPFAVPHIEEIFRTLPELTTTLRRLTLPDPAPVPREETPLPRSTTFHEGEEEAQNTLDYLNRSVESARALWDKRGELELGLQTRIREIQQRTALSLEDQETFLTLCDGVGLEKAELDLLLLPTTGANLPPLSAGQLMDWLQMELNTRIKARIDAGGRTGILVSAQQLVVILIRLKTILAPPSKDRTPPPPHPIDPRFDNTAVREALSLLIGSLERLKDTMEITKL
jgi:hypothetical protein